MAINLALCSARVSASDTVGAVTLRSSAETMVELAQPVSVSSQFHVDTLPVTIRDSSFYAVAPKSSWIARQTPAVRDTFPMLSTADELDTLAIAEVQPVAEASTWVAASLAAVSLFWLGRNRGRQKRAARAS